MPAFMHKASSSRRTSSRGSCRRPSSPPLGIVLEEMEMPDVQQQACSQTRFHECHLGSEVVWGEWRPAPWSVPLHAGASAAGSAMGSSAGNIRPGASARPELWGVDVPTQSGADVLALLALMLVSGKDLQSRYDPLTSIEELKLMLDLSREAQIILSQLGRTCLQHLQHHGHASDQT